MRKFTLIIASLFLSLGTLTAQETYVTDLNDLSNDKVYFIESARCFLMKSANVDGLATSNGTLPSDEEKVKELTNENQQFKIEKDGDNYYLYSVGAAKYVTNTGSWSDTKTNALTFENVGGDYPWKLCIDGMGLNSQDPGKTQSGIIVNSWTNADPGNCYKILDIAASSVNTITYNFTWNSETILTQRTTIGTGENYPAIDATILPFGFTATTPTGTVTADETKTIELTATFSWADSYENITAWYYLDLKDGKYLFHEEGTEYIALTKTSVDNGNKDAYTWGFIGDPINGFKIVNRAKGKGYILSSSENTSDGNTGGNTYPIMTEEPVAEGNNTYWVLTASNYRTNGFYIGQKDANNGMNRMNNRDNKLAYWNGGADLGSTFIMVERPIGAIAELEALIAEIEAAGITSGTNIGDYTEASVNSLNTAIETAEALVAGGTATESNVTALQAAYDALAVVLPDPNKFYYFDCTYAGRKLHINANNQLNWSDNTYDIKNSHAIFQFEAGSTLNTVKIKSVHTQSYMGEISGNITFGETGADIKIARSKSSEIADNLKPYAVMFTTDGTTGLHANTSPVSAWTNEAGSNHYVLTEATNFKHTLTVGAVGYSTLMLGFDATIPAGVECYYINAAIDEQGIVQLAQVEGAILPANTAVIVKLAEGQAAGDFEFAYSATADTAIEGNQLDGTLYNKSITPTGTAYVLAAPDNKVGLYKAELTDNAFLNNANKAFFIPTSDAALASYSFSFDWAGTTGIEGVEAEGTQNGKIYDITGREVKAITAPGIYIVNGRKVVK